MPLLRPLLFSLTVLLCLPSAWAVLGQPLAANVPANAGPPLRSALASTTPNPLYTTQVSTQDSGTVVTEYANTRGVVFALTWQGPVLPPLETLLGSYFSNFQAAADASRSRRSLGTPLQIQSDTLVVQSSGRMRHFSGYAYDPQRVPSGLNIHALLP